MLTYFLPLPRIVNCGDTTKAEKIKATHTVTLIVMRSMVTNMIINTQNQLTIIEHLECGRNYVIWFYMYHLI